MGLKGSWLKSLGLKSHLSRRLKDISTPDFSNHELFNPVILKFIAEKSGVEKFMVEKSEVEA
jgi:hypothetical protein